MDMSVSATGSSALREYQKQTAAGAGTDFPEAAQPTSSALIDGTNVNSPPGAVKLSDKTRQAPPALSLNSAYEDIDIKELNANLSAMMKKDMELKEYDQFAMDQIKENMRMHNEFFAKMRGTLGGPETAMAIPNDPLGLDPVRTSSGGTHPQSERIKDYIRAHKDEWDSLRSFKPPSFDEWQKTRG